MPDEPKPERLGAIFVDWDNLVIPAEKDRGLNVPGINVHLMRALLETSLKFVDKAHLFVFTAEGHINKNYFLEVDAEEFDLDLIVVPSRKDAADEAIRLKAEELMSEEGIDTFIFASGDGYFIPTVAKLIRDFGKKVVLTPYCKDNMHYHYRQIDDPTSKFSIIFLKPYFCKSG